VVSRDGDHVDTTECEDKHGGGAGVGLGFMLAIVIITVGPIYIQCCGMQNNDDKVRSQLEQLSIDGSGLEWTYGVIKRQKRFFKFVAVGPKGGYTSAMDQIASGNGAGMVGGIPAQFFNQAAGMPPQAQPLMPMSAAHGGSTMMSVQCPAGAATGAALQIQGLQGQMMQITVPPGVAPGQTFNVKVPMMQAAPVVGQPMMPMQPMAPPGQSPQAPVASIPLDM